MKLTNEQIINLARKCSMCEIEVDIFECSTKDLEEFANIIIEMYENEED